MAIPEAIVAAVGKNITVDGALAIWERMWKWGKTKKYEEAKRVAIREMLMGERCDWSIVEAAIAQGHDRKDNSVDAIRLRELHTIGKTAGRKKASKKRAGSAKPHARKIVKRTTCGTSRVARTRK